MPRILVMIFLSLPAAAQTQIDLRTQTKSVDFSSAVSTKPLKTGSVLPATCQVGDMFFNTDATPGANLYGCTAAGTWSIQGGSSQSCAYDTVDGTLKCRDAQGVVYATVRTANSGTANQWVDYISPAGVPHTSQPTAAAVGAVADPGSNGVPYRSGLGVAAPATADRLSMPFSCQDTGSSALFESPDDVTVDSGEIYGYGTPGSSPVTSKLINSILIPAKTGHSTAELASFVSDSRVDYSVLELNHDTRVGGTGLANFGAMQTDESGTTPATLASFKDNLLWANAVGGSFKLLTQSCTGAPKQNVCALANCDYNAGYNQTSTLSCAGATNQGNSYVSSWTPTYPGAHDLNDVDPRFVEQRHLALWNPEYLGNTASAWATGTAYTVGQHVTQTTAGVYGGLPVRYICTTAHTSGASTKPDVGASWRTGWEYASLNDLRAAIAAGTTYTDGAIGCVGCTPVQAITKWVQAGYIPMTPTLWCAGHDGETSGAVAFCAKGKALISAAGM